MAKLTSCSTICFPKMRQHMVPIDLQNSGHVMSGASCKANGAVYPAASAMMNSVKKPKMEQIQADHELFLQAFESENSLLANSLGLFVNTRETVSLLS